NNIWKNFDHFIVKRLRLFYFKNNPTFLLFKAYLEEKITIQQFKNRIYLAVPTIYVKHKKIKNFLQNYDLTIRNGNIEGEELHLRNLVFVIFWDVYNGLENPFSLLIRTQINTLMNYLNSLFNLRLRETEKLKFELFLGIFLCRIKHKNHLRKREDFFLMDSKVKIQLINNLKNRLFETNMMQEEYEIIEVKYLLGFLKMLVGEKIPITIKKEKFKKIDHVSWKIAKKLTQFIPYKDNRKNFYTRLEDGITEINRKHLVFENVLCWFNLEEQEKKVVHLYPLYSQAIKKVLAIYESKLFSYQDRWNLFYQYFFLLIELLPHHYYFEPIYVCIDFSRGKSYTKFIQRQFDHLQDLNIFVENYLSSKTDIFISDFEVPNLSVKQVIWNNPLILDDWQLFLSKFTQLIKEERLLKSKFKDFK
ncbi:hypothetical protein UAO_02379, partial [Enterococcus villorum ATCC 700913]